MNPRRVNAAAALIIRSMENGRKTPAGWAMDLESAQLLQSPETAEVAAQAVAAAERAVVELRREHEENARLRAALGAATDHVAALESDLGGATAEIAALKARLHEAASARTWRLENGKKFVYVEDIAPALLGVERKLPAGEDVTPQVAKLRSRLAGQREVLDGEHFAAVHHDYRTPHDLPETGGTR